MKKAALLLSLCMASAGCSSISDLLFGKGPPRTPLREITVSADIAANGGNATLLDIVFVYDIAAVARLPQTGPAWFQQKSALQNALADGIDVVSLQIPAASPDFKVALPNRVSRAVGVYALADYIGAGGQPIGNLTPWRRASIRLAPDTVVYTGH